MDESHRKNAPVASPLRKELTDKLVLQKIITDHINILGTSPFGILFLLIGLFSGLAVTEGFGMWGSFGTQPRSIIFKPLFCFLAMERTTATSAQLSSNHVAQRVTEEEIIGGKRDKRYHNWRHQKGLPAH
jgi:hypothetical protein